jgi:flagellar biosynthetic protein FliQ
MDPGQVMDLGRGALTLVMFLLAPLLGISLMVGLLIAVFQAATSINEMTLTFVPKLAVIILLLAVLGEWMVGLWVDFTRRLFEGIPFLFM